MEVDTTNLTEWMSQRQTYQDIVVEIAQKKLKEHAITHVAENPLSITEFAIGSYVLVDYPQNMMGTHRPHKLMAMRRGPYKVISRKDNTYTICNAATKKIQSKQIHLLRPYYHDPARTDPTKEALKDYVDQYIVERIISHKGRLARKRELTFQVKWLGFEEITEEPWETLRDNAVLHVYLRLQGLEKWIPTKIVEPTVLGL
jgi:hypothetical protein